jgi:hypothetical protein
MLFTKNSTNEKYLKPGTFFAYAIGLGGGMGYVLTQVSWYQRKEYLLII